MDCDVCWRRRYVILRYAITMYEFSGHGPAMDMAMALFVLFCLHIGCIHMCFSDGFFFALKLQGRLKQLKTGGNGQYSVHSIPFCLSVSGKLRMVDGDPAEFTIYFNISLVIRLSDSTKWIQTYNRHIPFHFSFLLMLEGFAVSVFCYLFWFNHYNCSFT